MKSETKNWQGKHWIRDEKRLAIYLRDGLACTYCRLPVEGESGLSLDHLIPRSKGGSNESTNLVTCCNTCNSSRGNRPMAQRVKAVAEYTQQTVSDIEKRVRNNRNRKLDMAAAREIMSRR